MKAARKPMLEHLIRRLKSVPSLDGKVVEKPSVPPSNVAIAGFYHFPISDFKIIEDLKYSDRGELEVADSINAYIDSNLCDLVQSESLVDYWIDTGINESLVHAANFVCNLKKNSGLSVAQLELRG